MDRTILPTPSNDDRESAKLFWSSIVHSSTREAFPSLPHPTYVPNMNASTTRSVKSSSKDFVSGLIPAALSLVLAKYAHSDEAIFARQLCCKNNVTQTSLRSANQSISTVPTKVKVDQSEEVSHYLQRIQDETMNAVSYAELSLGTGLSPTVEAASHVRTLLVEMLGDETEYNGQPFGDKTTKTSDRPDSYALYITCQNFEGRANLQVKYDSLVISDAQTECFLDLWQHVLEQLNDEGNAKRLISELDYVPASQKNRMYDWNSVTPKTIDLCVHDLVDSQVKLRPNSEAIFSWDGSFTYSELDILSTKLAHYLSKFGAGPDIFVPFCFQKSVWAVVTILAIVKSGGAFVAIDPNYPRNRIQTILSTAKASVVLVAPQNFHLFQGLLENVIVVHPTFVENLEIQHSPKLATVKPSNLAYMISTSGSTGIPKSILVEHRSLSTAILGLAVPMRIASDSRVLQFSSYTFDVSIGDIFTTLSQGGCICIPSEHDRINDLAGAIIRAKVDNACLTPTVASLLQPEEVPCLSSLSVGGEALTQKLLDTWAGHVNVTNIYGPSECTTWCAANAGLKSGSNPANLGKRLQALLWIVEDYDHNLLCPIGCIGELLVEGPVIARGYLDDQETKASFIENLAWAAVQPGSRRRFYKTGDLVKFDTEGSIIFIGRKDSQVKVHGHRIEIGEIEHHLSCHDAISKSVVVVPSSGSHGQQLVGILCLKSYEKPIGSSAQLEPLTAAEEDAATAQVDSIRDYLSAILPSYMVPQSWILVKSIPLLSSGKLNRPLAKEFAEKLFGNVRVCEPEEPKAEITVADKIIKLRQLWASVFNTSTSFIKTNSHFFKLGGNSFLAMRLVTLALQDMVSLTVADVFQAPVFAEMAARITLISTSHSKVLESQPFELVGGKGSAESIVRKEGIQWNLDWSVVKDIYPCTPLQAGLIALSGKYPGTYTFQHVYKLSPHIDLNRFKAAWATVVEKTAILRTIIIPFESCGTSQVVLGMGLEWQKGKDLDSYLAEDSESIMTYGVSLNRFAITSDNSHFIWTAHHSTYDGLSTALVLKKVADAYRTGTIDEAASILDFVRYIQSSDIETSNAYWRSQLFDAPSIPFPQLPSATYEALTNSILEEVLVLDRKAERSITTSALVRGAWAIVVSRYSDSDDIVFGATHSGRTAPVAGIDSMIGPTITTVPVRVQLDLKESIANYLQRIQEQSTEMMPFEQAGLQSIGSLGPNYQAACNFQNLLIIQTPETLNGLELLDLERLQLEGSGHQEIHTYPIKVDCILNGSDVTIRATYDDEVMTKPQVSRLLHHFSHVLQQLASETETKFVGDIDMLSPQDLTEIQHWNASLPEALETSIPKLFSAMVQKYPNAPAICSWDESFSYQELDNVSTKVAWFLKGLGVGPEVIVPVCFDKSAWAVVAMVGILRAGGAYVALHPAHPDARLSGIIRDVEAKLLLAAPQHAERFSVANPTVKVVSFGPDISESVKNAPSAAFPEISPSSPALVVFTSGSTGKPKGIILEHQALCTAINVFGTKCKIEYKARVFQFSAYIFDMSVGDMFTSLTRGACVCIPSEDDRMNDIAGAINKLDANVAFLTPTVASILKPEDVPGLKRLVLAGEASTLENVRAWAHRLDLNIFYGPAETSIYCSGTEPVKSDVNPANLGHAFAGHHWIADRNDHNKLAPVGCVGEILIEGPILARGYLNDPEKTSAAFIENPAFAKDFVYGRRRRFYKSGDLARYSPVSDGSMSFIARKDTQVKIRGQRVELAEIEYHIYAKPQVLHAVTAVPASGPFKERLVAMLSVTENLLSSEIVSPQFKAARGISIQSRLTKSQASSNTSEITDYLSEKLPPYMIPSAFVFVEKFPLNTSGKLDRREINAWFEEMNDEMYQLVIKLIQCGETNSPSTPEEELVQTVCSRTLNIDVAQVGLSQSFLSLGGDSITAMHVVSRCRSEGMAVSVRDILRSKTLRQLASHLDPIQQNSQTTDRGPASQSDNRFPRQILTAQDLALQDFISQTFGDEIEDIYPCTSVQNGMLISHARDNKLYDVCYILEVKSAQSGEILDIERLEGAWKAVVDRQPALRTIFFESPSLSNTFHQAVLKEHQADVVHLRSTDENPVPLLLAQKGINYNDLHVPHRLTICTTPKEKAFIKVEILHTLSDGTTWDLMFKELNQAYEGNLPSKPAPPYSRYVSYLQSQQSPASLDYWQQYLSKSQPCLFPVLNDSTNPQSEMLNIDVDFSRGSELLKLCKVHGVTVSNLLQATWSLVLRSYVKNNNVCFGYVVSGRDAPLDDIQESIGTYIRQLVCFVEIAAGDSIMQLVRKVQEDYLNALQYPCISLTELYHGLNFEGSQLFNTNMHLMRVSDPNGYDFSSLSMEYKHTVDPSEYNFTVGTWVSDEDVNIYMSFWSSLLSESEAKKVAQLISYTLNSILDNPERTVSSLGGGLGEEHEPSTIMRRNANKMPIESLIRTEELTSSEQMLQKLWSNVLGIQVQGIHPDIDFFQLGGDSFLGLKLTTAARESGASISISEIFSHPRFSEMALVLKNLDERPQIELSCHSPSTSRSPSQTEGPSLESSISGMSNIGDSNKFDKKASVTLQCHQNSFPSIRPQETMLSSDLEELKHFAPSDVEDLLPTTQVQQSILLSQARSTAYYNFRVIWEFASSTGETDIDIFVAIWQQIVNSHSILRTTFVQDSTQSHTYLQLVCKSVTAQIQRLKSANYAEALEALTKHPRINYYAAEPPHEMVICQAGGKTLVLLAISHALVDAVSLELLLKELAERYNFSTEPSVPSLPYKNLVSYTRQHCRSEAMQYWRQYLSDAKACQFPITNIDGRGKLDHVRLMFGRDLELKTFSQTSGVTLSTTFRAAWAISLNKWTGRRNVCFGQVLSGRDAPIEGAHEIIGPFINFVPCRVGLDQHSSVTKLLDAVQADFVSSLPHQFWLPELVDETGSLNAPLFNTLFNFRYNVTGEGSAGNRSNATCKMLWSEDPMEFDLVVAINNKGGAVEIEISYWDERVSHQTVTQVGQEYRKLIVAILESKTLEVGSIIC